MARRKRGTLLKGSLWALAVGLVFAGGMYWFPREYPELGRAEAFYYTLRLFILEHDLPEFPRSVPLVLIYFAAPAVALSALGTLINDLVREGVAELPGLFEAESEAGPEPKPANPQPR